LAERGILSTAPLVVRASVGIDVLAPMISELDCS